MKPRELSGSASSSSVICVQLPQLCQDQSDILIEAVLLRHCSSGTPKVTPTVCDELVDVRTYCYLPVRIDARIRCTTQV